MQSFAIVALVALFFGVAGIVVGSVGTAKAYETTPESPVEGVEAGRWYIEHPDLELRNTRSVGPYVTLEADSGEAWGGAVVPPNVRQHFEYTGSHRTWRYECTVDAHVSRRTDVDTPLYVEFNSIAPVPDVLSRGVGDALTGVDYAIYSMVKEGEFLGEVHNTQAQLTHLRANGKDYVRVRLGPIPTLLANSESGLLNVHYKTSYKV